MQAQSKETSKEDVRLFNFAKCAPKSLQRGVVAEWSKAAGLGPVLSGGVGSNPTDIKMFLQL